MVGQSVYDQDEFQHFITILYDEKTTVTTATKFTEYENQIKAFKAGGSTNFVAVFQYIERLVKQNQSMTDISIIFFTDGCDTCNTMSVILDSLDKLKKVIAKQSIVSRFLTIGFTSEHDATFLNRIAQAGTDLGNFFYVNTSDQNYPD